MSGKHGKATKFVAKVQLSKLQKPAEYPKMGEGLVGLLADGSNVDEWEEALYEKAEFTFGFAGKCLRAKGYEVRPARTPEEWDQFLEEPGLGEAGMVIARSKYTEKLFSLREQDLEQHGKIFGMVTSTVPLAATKKLEKIENFTTARDADDPAQAMAIIRRRVVMNMDGLSELEQQTLRLSDFYLRKQGNEEEIPETFDGLRDSRESFVPSNSKGFVHQSVSHAVYETQVGQKGIGPCYHCGLMGHLKHQCKSWIAKQSAKATEERDGSESETETPTPTAKPKGKGKPKPKPAKATKAASAGAAGKKKKNVSVTHCRLIYLVRL